MSTLCFFLLVSGGVAYAAGHLGKNSVGTRQLKRNSVTGLKVKDKTLTGRDIDLATLGTTPSATDAQTLGGLSEKNKVTFERDFQKLATRVKDNLSLAIRTPGTGAVVIDVRLQEHTGEQEGGATSGDQVAATEA